MVVLVCLREVGEVLFCMLCLFFKTVYFHVERFCFVSFFCGELVQPSFSSVFAETGELLSMSLSLCLDVGVLFLLFFEDC